MSYKNMNRVHASDQAFILIGTPLGSLPAGGFVRDAKVLPYFVYLLRRREYSPVLYVPAYSITSSINMLVGGNKEFEEAVSLILAEIRKLKGIRGLDTELLESAVEQGYSWAYKLLREPSFTRRLRNFGYLYAKSIKSVEKKLIKKLYRSIKQSYDFISFVYSMNENWEHFSSLYHVVNITSSPSGVMLQQPLYRTILFNPRTKITANIASIQLNSYIRSHAISLLRKRLLRIILSVSPTPLIETGDLVAQARSFGTKIAIPVPGNAVEKEIISYRKLDDKPPMAVYFGRLTPTKGVYDLLQAWRLVERRIPGAVLRVIGSFDKESTRSIFFSLRERLGLKNVEYLGFIKHGKGLYQAVSQAKLLIYPSYEDSYSLVVLEAVALGLLVVAYDIPALRYIYGRVPAVRLVKQGDIAALARNSIELLLSDSDTYYRLQEAAATRKFIELHTSWKKVAEAEMSRILGLTGQLK